MGVPEGCLMPPSKWLASMDCTPGWPILYSVSILSSYHQVTITCNFRCQLLKELVILHTLGNVLSVKCRLAFVAQDVVQTRSSIWTEVIGRSNVLSDSFVPQPGETWEQISCLMPSCSFFSVLLFKIFLLFLLLHFPKSLPYICFYHHFSHLCVFSLLSLYSQVNLCAFLTGVGPLTEPLTCRHPKSM